MVRAVQDGTGIVALQNMSVDVEKTQLELPMNGEMNAALIGLEEDSRFYTPSEVAPLQIENSRLRSANEGMARLVRAIQELSLARNLDKVMEIVRTTARALTGADGATFVLREGD